MERTNKDVIEIDIGELFYVLLQKFWIILLVCIAGAAAARAISTYFLQPVYTSTTKVYVINRQDDTKMTLSDLETGTQLTKDYKILVKSRPVTEQVIRSLNLNMTSNQLAGLIQVNTPEDTRILEIMVNHQDPVLAKQLADAVAKISGERMVSVMGMEKVNIIEEGNLPSYPSSPNVMMNTILGGLLGSVLASIIIVIVFMTNDTIRTSEDIEKYIGITTLGILPLEENYQDRKTKKVKKSKRRRKKNSAALAG